jgi:hypothetical protein
MRQPLLACEGLHLANSLITRTFHQNKLKEWKSGHLKNMADYKKDGNYELTSNLWKAFIRQNPLPREKKYVMLDSFRDDFCTVPNFA